MDLHSYEVDDLYFEKPVQTKVLKLIEKAANGYETGESEVFLLEAKQLAPNNLMVLVALYRFYYYQYRYEEALGIAEIALTTSGRLFNFEHNWRQINLESLSYGLLESFGMVRFYLLALKGSGYLCLRLGRMDEGIERLEKVVELDSSDRLGAASLLEVAYNQKGIYNLKHRMSA